MNIPKALIDQIQEGNVVLFLGAGASIAAKHPEGKKVPQGQELADLIAVAYPLYSTNYYSWYLLACVTSPIALDQ